MDCAASVASSTRLPSPRPFTGRLASQLAAASVPCRRLQPPSGALRTKRSLSAPLVAASSRRDHGQPCSPDDDDGLYPPSTASSSSSSSFHPTAAGRMVDEGMLVLRNRIRDARMAETNYEPPEGWADWERAYYTRYGADVCAALGALQAFLLATRPAAALGAAAVLALSLPVSAAAVVLAVVHGARAIGAGMGIL